MAKQSGKCAFCGGGGLTKEHLWPKWLHPHVVETSKEPYRGGFRMVGVMANANTLVLTPDLVREQGYWRNKRFRVVCKGCNGGWMSSTEQLTRPLIKDMFLEKPLSLKVEDQKSLATWAALRTCIAEYDDPKHIAVSDNDRELLMKHGAPPDHWAIFLGRHNLPGWILRFRHFGAQAALAAFGPELFGRTEKCNTQSTMIGFNNIALLVVSSSVAAAQQSFRKLSPPGMTRIWPPSDAEVAWPLAEILTSEQMDANASCLER
ncbi:hypothetical protein ACRQ1B_06250 [Rhizobium panacihumi]|uniref:hypothetical protein n=1 Tax=Rhizobium panacihumi TaxID=2008450 RepID=UPI003D7B4A32